MVIKRIGCFVDKENEDEDRMLVDSIFLSSIFKKTMVWICLSCKNCGCEAVGGMG